MVDIRLCSNISARPPVTVTVVKTERSNMCSQGRSANEGLQKEVNVKWDDCFRLTPQLNTTIGNWGCQIVEVPADAHLSYRVICEFQDVVQQLYRNFVNAGHFRMCSRLLVDGRGGVFGCRVLVVVIGPGKLFVWQNPLKCSLLPSRRSEVGQ